MYGHDIPFDRVRPLMGMGGDRLLCALVSIDADLPKGEEIVATRKKIFLHDYLGAVQPFPGVRELLQRMRGEGLKLAVASSSDEEILEELLTATRRQESDRRASQRIAGAKHEAGARCCSGGARSSGALPERSGDAWRYPERPGCRERRGSGFRRASLRRVERPGSSGRDRDLRRSIESPGTFRFVAFRSARMIGPPTETGGSLSADCSQSRPLAVTST